MAHQVMIYGATGYTGDLVSKQAKHVGLDFVLAGRSQESLQSMAALLNAPYRVFDLGDPSDLIDANLGGGLIKVLLNCAGPFRNTAVEHLIEACIRNGVHYLDTSAELDTYDIADRRDMEAKAAGIMLLPGCANILGCLASWVEEEGQAVDLALHVSGPTSQGSANTARNSIATECLQRRDGKITSQDATSTLKFDFADGRGPVVCFPITLPEITTMFKFPGVPNIRTYFNASSNDSAVAPDSGPGAQADGPSTEERERNPYHAAMVVTAVGQDVKRTTILHTVNGYTFVSLALVEAARLIVGGRFEAGFQTSARIFGADFAMQFANIFVPLEVAADGEV